MPDQLGRLASVLDCSIDDLFALVNADDPDAGNAGPSKTASGGTRHGRA